MLRLVDDLGDVQQRLRRNAAAIETDAAGVLLLVDERHLHAEIGGVEGGRIAAGAGPENRELYGFSHQPMSERRKGCSIASATQRRNRIASAPSMTR
ncbi:hypothetical protein D3C83_33150 [compost metagenome]